MKATNITLTPEAVFASGIPQKFHELDMDKYQGSHYNLQQLRKYTANIQQRRKDGLGLFIQGGGDSGKTLFICNILLVALSCGMSAAYHNLYEVTESILSKEANYKTYTSPDFWALDNLLYENVGIQQSVLYRILVARKDACKPTIIGTRIREKEKFIATYGADTWETIHSNCHELTLAVDDSVRASLRKKKVEDFFES